MELPQEPEFEMGGGGLYSTAGDYPRFARMILDGRTLDGARILSVRQLRQGQRMQWVIWLVARSKPPLQRS
jgi:methyl acetate hydrolase